VKFHALQWLINGGARLAVWDSGVWERHNSAFAPLQEAESGQCGQSAGESGHPMPPH
jgi:hypothetical protein